MPSSHCHWLPGNKQRSDGKRIDGKQALSSTRGDDWGVHGYAHAVNVTCIMRLTPAGACFREPTSVTLQACCMEVRITHSKRYNMVAESCVAGMSNSVLNGGQCIELYRLCKRLAHICPHRCSALPNYTLHVRLLAITPPVQT
jgi:hypothetical protein